MWSPRLKNVESKISFGQLILRKIIKTAATRCQILRLKCTKIQNSARAPPQTTLGELTALPRPRSWIEGGLLLRGGEWGREWTGVLWSPKVLKIDPEVNFKFCSPTPVHKTPCALLQPSAKISFPSSKGPSWPFGPRTAGSVVTTLLGKSNAELAKWICEKFCGGHSTLDSSGEVTVRWARLVLEWVTSSPRLTSH